MPEEIPAALTDLARSFGIATEYTDWRGNYVRVSEDTIRTVLSVFDVDTSSPESLDRAVRDRAEQPWRQVVPPVVVLREGWTPWVPIHIPHGAQPRVKVVLEEGGVRDVQQVDNWVEPRSVDGQLIGEATFELPGDLPLGYHTLIVSVEDVETAASVIVTPQTLALPPALRDSQAWGLLTQLYAVRSRRSWGIGDAADLGELAGWAAHQGGDFVLVNPVHAAEPVAPMEASPYLPTSRRFVNPIYIRPEEILEAGYLPHKRRKKVERQADDARLLTAAPLLDRDAAWADKDAALRVIFAAPRSPRRQALFEDFTAAEGQGLLDFATWWAITVDRDGEHWTQWPEPLRDPRSGEVEAERNRLADEVDYACWLQWIVQGQLSATHREAREAGMGVGIIHDLAVGVHPEGADSWRLGAALAGQVTVGAPPDDYNQLGQNWSQPPWRPDRLAELAYEPFRSMVRTSLRMSGGLRVDHILGLFRLWWIPQGQLPTQGTYVRYDHEALIGILALEAQRADAVVIGEDLGTVESWVRDYLRERGILGTSILWFERREDGGPKSPETYRTLCLASVTTHDLPPTAGYLQGEHVRVREELGLLTQPLAEEQAIDANQRELVMAELRERGVLPEGADIEGQVAALYRYLTWAPSRLLGVSVNDLVGDVRTINQPGTDKEYPNWKVPLGDGNHNTVLLDGLLVSDRAKRLVRTVNRRDR